MISVRVPKEIEETLEGVLLVGQRNHSQSGLCLDDGNGVDVDTYDIRSQPNSFVKNCASAHHGIEDDLALEPSQEAEGVVIRGVPAVRPLKRNIGVVGKQMPYEGSLARLAGTDQGHDGHPSRFTSQNRCEVSRDHLEMISHYSKCVKSQNRF